MQRFPKYTKKIACLEGDWFGWDDSTSVRPALEMLQTTTGAPFVYRRCNAIDEFEYGLEKTGRSPSFHLVYLAFHGSPGRIQTDLFNITLEELAERMGRRFKDQVIHFGACSTLRCSEERVAAFLESTGASMVTGFTVDVDWVESTAFDLLYLGLWQQYVDVSAFQKRLRSAYAGLIDRLGFVMTRVNAEYTGNHIYRSDLICMFREGPGPQRTTPLLRSVPHPFSAWGSDTRSPALER